jgi:hypothetical protein
VNGILALLLLLVIVPLALRANPSPPPQIAEFNPSEQQIKEAPPDQSTAFGLGGPGGGSGGAGSGLGGDQGGLTPSQLMELARLARLSGSPSPLDASRVRHCVGNPPRQTEDPQSPPCVPYFFEGDNGGATAKGVTKDQIIVATGGDWGPNDVEMIALEKYFNSRYEFYGRKIKLVRFTPGATGGCSWPRCYTDGPDPIIDKGDAVKVAQQLNAFANVYYAGRQGKKKYFYDELARQHVIGIDADALTSTEADFTANQPYQWNYYPAWDTNEANMAGWACNRLNNRPASFTQAPLSGQTRKFGLLVAKFGDNSIPDISVFKAGLAACGVSELDKNLVVDEVDIGATAADFQNSVARMQHPSSNPLDPSVTTIFCFCEGGVESASGFYHIWIAAATNAAYFPEYIVDHLYGQDREIFLLFVPPCDPAAGFACSPQNRNHMFGILPDQKWVDKPNLPCYYAPREADTSVVSDCGSMNSAGIGQHGTSGYHALLLLASGIQAAGKILTPQTFQDGLARTVFPNPDCGGPPLYQSCVGFGSGRHAMVNDYVEVWASSQDVGNDQGVNATYCYGSGGNLGPRYRLGTWPRDPPGYFTEPCGNH